MEGDQAEEGLMQADLQSNQKRADQDRWNDQMPKPERFHRYSKGKSQNRPAENTGSEEAEELAGAGRDIRNAFEKSKRPRLDGSEGLAALAFATIHLGV